LQLMKLISEMGQEHLSIWPHYEIVKHMMGSVAVAIQKGNVMTVLAGYTNTLAKKAAGRGRERKGEAEVVEEEMESEMRVC